MPVVSIMSSADEDDQKDAVTGGARGQTSSVTMMQYWGKEWGMGFSEGMLTQRLDGEEEPLVNARRRRGSRRARR
jgi:hypothetical protein